MKKIKFIIELFVVIIISYAISFIYTNYDLIRNKESIGIINLEKNINHTTFNKMSNNKFISNDTEAVLNFKIDKKYIEYLTFNYKTDKNFKWKIILQEEDYYGNYKEKIIEGVASDKISVFSEKISNKINDLSIYIYEENIEINDIEINNKITYNSSIYIIILLFGISVFLIIKYKKIISKKIEYLFLIIVLVTGTSMIICTPLTTGIAWDDQIHFDHVYSLANKYYTIASIELLDPISTNFTMFNTKQEKEAYKNHLNEAHNIKTENRTNIRLTYKEIGYIGQSAVFAILEKINLSFSTILLTGKLVNLIIYALVIFFAIKKLPKGKYLMMVISLIPTAIFLASNYSYDPTVTAFLFLGISYFLYELLKKENKLDTKNIAISICSLIIASFPKAVYIPIILLLLILPSNKFKNKQEKKKFSLAIIIIFVLIMSTFVLPTLTTDVAGDPRGGNTNVSNQLRLIIKQPLSFSEVFKDSAIISGMRKMFGEEGLTSFAYYGIVEDCNIYFLILILLLFSINIENKKSEKNLYLTKNQKIWIIVLLTMIICLIWVALYLSFTPVASLGINGVQNRYFIPLIFITLVLFNNKNSINEYKDNFVYYTYSIILLTISFSSIIIQLI